MQRRSFLTAAGGTLSGVVAGCQSSADLEAEIDVIELENHRRDEQCEFAVRIEREEETVFQTTRQLDVAGSGSSTAVLERPVDGRDDYEVVVSAGEYTASPNTRQLTSGDQTCLRLEFYLGTSTLHWEHTNYSEC